MLKDGVLINQEFSPIVEQHLTMPFNLWVFQALIGKLRTPGELDGVRVDILDLLWVILVGCVQVKEHGLFDLESN
jgi:hypothetical protein